MKKNNLFKIKDLKDLVETAFLNSNVSKLNAEIVAEALVKAEIDGKYGHGLSRVTSYSAQAKVGKVDGYAEPKINQKLPSVISIDASNDFKCSFIDLNSLIIKETRASFLGSLSKILVSKMKIGSTFSPDFRALNNATLSCNRRSLRNQNIEILSINY